MFYWASAYWKNQNHLIHNSIVGALSHGDLKPWHHVYGMGWEKAFLLPLEACHPDEESDLNLSRLWSWFGNNYQYYPQMRDKELWKGNNILSRVIRKGFVEEVALERGFEKLWNKNYSRWSSILALFGSEIMQGSMRPQGVERFKFSSRE